MLPHPWMVSQSRTRSPGREPTNSEWSTDVRFGAHSGLKLDIAALPKSAMCGHQTIQNEHRFGLINLVWLALSDTHLFPYSVNT